MPSRATTMPDSLSSPLRLTDDEGPQKAGHGHQDAHGQGQAEKDEGQGEGAGAQAAACQGVNPRQKQSEKSVALQDVLARNAAQQIEGGAAAEEENGGQRARPVVRPLVGQDGLGEQIKPDGQGDGAVLALIRRPAALCDRQQGGRGGQNAAEPEPEPGEPPRSGTSGFGLGCAHCRRWMGR